MTTQQATEKLKGFDLIGSNEDIEFQYALNIAIQALEQIQEIKDIIIQHDADRMPEDFWYLDQIREVVNK